MLEQVDGSIIIDALVHVKSDGEKYIVEGVQHTCE
jgi:hypothetical protein